MRPQTNKRVERFNGRIKDVVRSQCFRNGQDLTQTLLCYVHLCDNQLPRSMLKGRMPIDALRDW
jgi:hypothetical protein